MHWKAWLRIIWKLLNSWQMLKETVFQNFYTYRLPPTSSLLLSKDLRGLHVIVTGCTNGIGLETAREFAMAGAHLTMACRNVEAAKQLASMWTQDAQSNSRTLSIEVMELDLSLFSSVRKFAKEWERRAKPLDILINNAGILKQEESQKFSEDGLEIHMHVNHVAPALLTLLLLPSLLRAPSSRIINVNSVGHHLGVVQPQYWDNKMEDWKFTNVEAYGSSKLSHIMFLKVLANKLLNRDITTIQCIAVHPGAVCTNLLRGMTKALFMFDAVEGARTTIFGAINDNVPEKLVKGFVYFSCNCEPGKMSRIVDDMESCLDIWNKTLNVLDLQDDYLYELIKDYIN